MHPYKKRYLWLVVFVTAVGLLFPSCGGDDASKESESTNVPLVEAVKVRYGALPLEASLPGVIRAENQVSIHPEISATVAEVLVQIGETVRGGQPLVRLNTTQLREQLEIANADLRLAEARLVQAEATLKEIETRYKRVQQLAADQLVSPQELDSVLALLESATANRVAAQASIEQARAEVEEREAAISKTLIRSPVSGRVGTRRVEVGQLVSPSTPLFTVGNLKNLIVEVELTETMLGQVQVGQPVIIESRGENRRTIEAEVSRISPFLAESSFTTTAEVDINNEQGLWLPGMYVEVRILYGNSEQATLIPASALWENPEDATRGVFVIQETASLIEPTTDPAEIPDKNFGVRFIAVDVIAEGSAQVGIGGVPEGSWVVVTGQHLLHRSDEAEVQARIRPSSWSRLLSLQQLQREDLLEGFLNKQRRVAQIFGATIPASEAEVQAALNSTSDDSLGKD